MQARVAAEVEVLRWCIDWLAQLERGEMVVVNLRPDTEDGTEFVRFDHARVLRVLARIAADLDAVARQDPATEPERLGESPHPRTRHRKRLAESDAKPRSRAAKEQRDALRNVFGLPLYCGGYADPGGIHGGRTRERSVPQTRRDSVRFCSAAPGRPVWTGAASWGRVGPSRGPWGDGLGKGGYGDEDEHLEIAVVITALAEQSDT
jgi:hypothetical protein